VTTTGLAGRASRGTVLRRRERGGALDEIPGSAAQRTPSNPPRMAAPAARRPHRPRARTRLVVISLAAATAVAVGGAAAWLAFARSPSPSRPAAVVRPRPQPTASYSFPAQRYRTGLVVARRWTLSGKDGTVLTETTTLSNVTDKAMTTWFKDSIPAAITDSMQALRFTVVPAKIVSSDPVVEWYVRLPAHGAVTLGYVVSVPPEGTTAARLDAWAKGLDTVEARLNAPVPKPTPTPSVEPSAPYPYPTYTPPSPTPSPTPTGPIGF
jgi:hypothetical protein